MMRIGYAGRNLTLDLPMPPRLRPETWSPEAFGEVVRANLAALETTLRWNIDHGIWFYRLNPWTIPFASHPVVTVPWREVFAPDLERIGEIIRGAEMRITVHPGQYILLNSPDETVVQRSVSELVYHADLFDLFGLDRTHKIQIHTGGIFDDKAVALDRWARSWQGLPENVRERLAIENDERLFSLADNVRIHAATGVPLIFDTFHHSILNAGEALADALDQVQTTWSGHGPVMVDYSTQDPAKGPGAHAATIDLEDFAAVLGVLDGRDVDVMLEIKDKEKSALAAMDLARTWSAKDGHG
jgi:UV DNA damage endonuclease